MFYFFRKSKIFRRVFQCCGLNCFIFLFSIYLFDRLILPGLQYLLSVSGNSSKWDWIHPILSFVFSMIWILPLFLLSKIVNGLWFQDIADSAYRFRIGRPQLLPSISKYIADLLFNLLVQTLFLVQVSFYHIFPKEYFRNYLYYFSYFSVWL